MGGIARLIRKLPVVKQHKKFDPLVKAARSKTGIDFADLTIKPKKSIQVEAKKVSFGGGTTNKTVLTSAQGVEDEANVAKTVLGGAATKKKQTNNFGY